MGTANRSRPQGSIVHTLIEEGVLDLLITVKIDYWASLEYIGEETKPTPSIDLWEIVDVQAVAHIISTRHTEFTATGVETSTRRNVTSLNASAVQEGNDFWFSWAERIAEQSENEIVSACADDYEASLLEAVEH